MTRAEKIRRRLFAQIQFLIESSTDEQIVALYESLAVAGIVSPADDMVQEQVAEPRTVPAPK